MSDGPRRRTFHLTQSTWSMVPVSKELVSYEVHCALWISLVTVLTTIPLLSPQWTREQMDIIFWREEYAEA